MSANSLVPDVTTTIKKPKVEKPNAQELPVQKDALADSLTDSLNDTLVDPLDVQLTGGNSETDSGDDGASAAPGHDPSEQPEGGWGTDRAFRRVPPTRETEEETAAERGDGKATGNPDSGASGKSVRPQRT